MAESKLVDSDNGLLPKQPRTAKENGSIHDTPINFSTFEMKKVLNINPVRKTIFVMGYFTGHESPAVIILEKKNFPEDDIFLKRGFFNEGTILREGYRNDVYGKYECFPTREHNGLNVTIIHPATQKHIDKYSMKELYIIEETYDTYTNITLPYLQSNQFSLQWVNNILEGKAETDRVIHTDKDEETGFVMLPDLKWNMDPKSLQILVIAKKKIKSLRELNASHIPLLKNIRDTGSKIIKEKFNVPPSQLRIYLHYQPSYYQMHVHFAYLMYEAPGIYTEKAHLLSTVINNLEMMPDYYQKATLSFVVSESDPLSKKLQELGVLVLDEKIVEENEMKN